jgi:hypothetical protein
MYHAASGKMISEELAMARSIRWLRAPCTWDESMAVKLTHLQLHWGLAGAREKFEDMTAQLIHVERPNSQRVRVVKGDGGLDSFDGSLSDPNGIDVFQVKYFPNGIEKSQKNQIRESFAAARNSKKFKVKGWTLCLPIETRRPSGSRAGRSLNRTPGSPFTSPGVRCTSKVCSCRRRTGAFARPSSRKRTRNCSVPKLLRLRRSCRNW